MKRALVIGLMVLLLAPLAWAAGETPKKGGSLIVCVGDEPPGLDPTASASAAIDRVVYSNVFEGLVKVDRNGKLVPGLASKWEFSPDGRWMATGTEREYRLWSVPGWQLVARMPANGMYDLPGRMAFSPDSRALAIVPSWFAARLVEVPSGRELATFEAPEVRQRIDALRFSPNGGFLAAGNRECREQPTDDTDQLLQASPQARMVKVSSRTERIGASGRRMSAWPRLKPATTWAICITCSW